MLIIMTMMVMTVINADGDSCTVHLMRQVLRYLEEALYIPCLSSSCSGNNVTKNGYCCDDVVCAHALFQFSTSLNPGPSDCLGALEHYLPF